jgi:hypothetical protein
VDGRGGVEAVRVTKSQAAAQARIAAGLAAPGFALPGTLSMQSYRCGKANCRCAADPPQLHGPYPLWTRKVGNKTVTQRLSAAEADAYQPWFDNAKRLRALLAELQELSLQIVRSQGASRPPTQRPRREERRSS